MNMRLFKTQTHSVLTHRTTSGLFSFYFSGILFSIIIIFLLNACSNCPSDGRPYLLSGRRPPVMTGVPECVLDYGGGLEEGLRKGLPCEDECQPLDENTECEPGLDAQFYDPYEPPVSEFHMSVGDILEILIYGEEESHFEKVAIAPDGCLYYAILDGVPAAGRTLSSVSKDLEKALEKYYKHPRVTLNLVESSSMMWKIFGKVQKTGVYPLEGPLTLRQAIGVAGGLAVETYEFKTNNSDLETLADLENSFMIRNGQMLDIDFKKLIHRADERYNIFIKPGDYIYIASIAFREVYVLGNVRVPLRLQYEDDMTLMQALAEAGGWLLGGPFAADMSNCLVIRGDLENPCVIRCDLCLLVKGEAKDFYLVPGDIIYVHNKTMRFARSLVTLAIETFVQSFATTASSYYADNKWFFVQTSDTDSSSSTEDD
jgi:polysaccharide biosynthesis/export protein